MPLRVILSFGCVTSVNIIQKPVENSAVIHKQKLGCVILFPERNGIKSFITEK